MSEHKRTQYVSEANSTVRASIAKEGGYFPTDLHCTLETDDDADAKASDNITIVSKDTPNAKDDDEDLHPPKSDKFTVLAGRGAKKSQATVSATAKSTAVSVTSSGASVKALLRSEATDRSVGEIAPHRFSGVAAAEVPLASQETFPKATHRRRSTAREAPLHPRTPLFSGDALGLRRKGSRGNLPGLPSRREAPLSPWERSRFPAALAEAYSRSSRV